MEDKKEVQQKIIPSAGEKVTEEELSKVLKIVSPGTSLRSAMNGVLNAKRGSLIVMENKHLLPLIDGGFRVNCKFTPQRIVELSKMDGAIILSDNIKKVNYANVILTPDNKIKTSETGARHKAAERTAKQTGSLVIAISERRGEMTLFYKNLKYPIKETDALLRKANEYIQILEKQGELFDRYIEKLKKTDPKEKDLSLRRSINVIQKGLLMQKIAREIKKCMIELGNESALLKTRFKEIMKDIKKETDFVIGYYTKIGFKKSKILFESLTYDEIIDKDNITKALGYFINN